MLSALDNINQENIDKFINKWNEYQKKLSKNYHIDTINDFISIFDPIIQKRAEKFRRKLLRLYLLIL
jgi:hypothetical protein